MNTKILPDVPGETVDTPKKFRNIDKEPFEFTWDGVPFGGALPGRAERTEEVNEFTEIDKDGKKVLKRDVTTHYTITKGIEPGEVVIMPKYLVNYAAMHLARKMFKRQAIDNYVPEKADRKELEIPNARIQIVNADKEMALQKQMVSDNFESEKEEKEEKVEEVEIGRAHV